MKKSLLFFCLLIGFQVFAQMPGVPDSINYQAVLRDASGNVLTPGTSGTLNFRIYSDFNSANPDYEEDHPFTTDAVGLVQLFIGGGNQIGSNTMANVNWQAGTACYEVRLNNTLIGSKQAFASVPYALYAKSAGGGSLPQGLQNQTLYHDGSVWRPTNNLANDGTNVGIGLMPNNRVKLNVFSNNSDSTVISGTRTNASGRDAAIRGGIIGSSIGSVINPNSTAIFGADFTSTNLGTGFGIGVSGVGVSGGVAVGASGVATGGATSTLIGVYGSVESSVVGPNRYAAFFNKGKVLVNESIIFPSVTNNTTTLFYTLNAGNEGVWAPLPLSSSLSVIGNGIISVSPLPPSSNYTVSALPPAFTSTNIGNITTTGYPNYQLNIPSPSFSYNPANGLFSYTQAPFSTNLIMAPAVGLAGNILTVAGNAVTIPQLNFWARPTATATELGNPADNVGIGITNPTEKLVVHNGNANIDVSFLTTPTNTVWLNMGTTTNHFLGRIGYHSNTNMMSFWTNNLPDRLVINNNGNVGIATNIPAAKLDINGDFKLGTGGNILVKVIGGSAQPNIGTINPGSNLFATFAAPGAATGDRVVVTMAGGTSTAVFLGSASVTGLNTIGVNLFNTGATGTAGGTYTFNYIIYK